ncbi:MAG TPA: hypothetical protein VH500_18415 [Nitrososphaeraceae archaeon]|jgi:hypothetical protein
MPISTNWNTYKKFCNLIVNNQELKYRCENCGMQDKFGLIIPPIKNRIEVMIAESFQQQQ